ncbi:hypothetical protein LSAT2_026166 [Lamellibrachia satsuma]|nr:hypothetical protein LSAT2_026166 [Lamellibrachia satsuma]
MYHDAKAKRQRLLREHEKKRDRLAQIKSNEAMDEHERLSLRSQSRTTSRQTSPRLGSRKNAIHPTDTDGSGSEGASSSGKNGRQAWSPSTVDDFIPEGVEDPKEVLSEETVGHNKTVNGNDVASSAASDSNSSVLPNQCENNAEVNGNNLDQPDSNGLEDGSALSPADGVTRRKGGKSKSKSTNSTDVVDTVVSNG